jgi:hypothetical protein
MSESRQQTTYVNDSFSALYGVLTRFSHPVSMTVVYGNPEKAYGTLQVLSRGVRSTHEI